MITRLRYIRIALDQHCAGDENLPMSFWRGWRLTAKFVLCALLLPQRPIYCVSGRTYAEVANFDPERRNTPDGIQHSWRVLAVGVGWFTWRWEVAHDGT